MNELDAVRLHFSPESLIALDVILALVLFGVALDMRVQDFRGILTSPRGTLIGLLAHSVLLPAVAFALKAAGALRKDQVVVVNLSGRGDKDLDHVMALGAEVRS